MTSAGPSSSWTDRLRSLDSHSPVSNEFRVRTLQGGILSVLTVASILLLVRSEYAYNLTPQTLDHVKVMPDTPDGLEVEFDLSFPHIPCALLAVDANDPTGQSQSLHIDRKHRIWKHRLDKNGKRIGTGSKFEMGNTMTEESHLDEVGREKGVLVDNEDNADASTTLAADAKKRRSFADTAAAATSETNDEEECGSCYGAGDEGECCNTCDDVKRAYRRKMWHIDDIHGISQCAHAEKSADEDGEGCNVRGMIALGTGGGNLHFAPDRKLEKEGEKSNNPFGDMFDLLSLVDFFNEAFETFNVTHTINEIRFGPPMTPRTKKALGLTSQLTGQSRVVEDGYGMFQYYLQVVPTKYSFLNGTTIETFQYSVTEHTRHVNPGSNRGLPGVFFFYEVSALHVEFEEYVRGWTHFFTGVCAAVGGAFTVMGMLDRYLYGMGKGGIGGGATLG